MFIKAGLGRANLTFGIGDGLDDFLGSLSVLLSCGHFFVMEKLRERPDMRRALCCTEGVLRFECFKIPHAITSALEQINSNAHGEINA